MLRLDVLREENCGCFVCLLESFVVGFELFYLCCSALCGSFWRVFSKVSLVF